MTRLVGFLDRREGDQGAILLDRMLEASQPLASWKKRTETAGDMGIGLCGRSTEEVANASGILAVVDGHIYNREELGSFATDAEAVTALYQRFGFSRALAKLNGDFAIALYDEQRRVLWLGRDRFGIRPLYYTMAHGAFAFASRPRALLALPGVSREVNPQFVALFAASHYRCFDNDPDRSPYLDIRQLPAAHVLRLSGGVQATTSRYWSLNDEPDLQESEAALAERYRDLMLDAVAKRLRRARRPAFTLSGGMDSSSVLGCAVRLRGEKQHAFSTVYDDATYDESTEIRSMLASAVERWHTVAIGTPDVFGLVRCMIEAHDEPVATATWLSHFLLCEKAASQGIGSLFGGLGGDELNAGEYEHFLFHFADLRLAGDEERLRQEVECWVRYHDHPVYRKSFSVVEEGFGRLVDMQRPGRCLPDRRRLGRYAAALDREYFNLQEFEPVMDHPFRSYLKNRTYQDLMRETIPCCLRAEDRQAAAVGMDHFLPFLDHRLVELMYRIPGTLKFRAGVAKHLLRQAMHGILPEETRTRIKKTGWNAPAHVWFSGVGGEQLLDLVHSQRFKERGIYHVPEVLRLVQEHQQIVSSGKPAENHMMFLWQLVNLELWLQTLET
jgi:asparagine synthase (glutamine-hydrolysing)